MLLVATAMPLPVQSYVWPRLKNVIGNWITLVTGLTQDQLLWSEQNQPAPARSPTQVGYVGLTRRTLTSHGFDDEATTLVPVAATATVTASAAGETAKLILGKRPLVYTLAGLDTTETARDALLTQAQASYEPVVATPDSTDKIDFIGKGSQAIRVSAVEGATVDETLEYRRHTNGMRRAIVRVSLFGFSSDGADLDESADEYADALISSLLTPGEPGSIFLYENSVGVEGQASITTQNVSVDLPGPSGKRETRLMFDVQFNAASRRFFPEDPADAVVPPIIEVLA